MESGCKMTTLLGPFEINRVHHGDALALLKRLPDGCIHCVVTSPPYWGLRDYGVEGQLGLESTPLEHVERMVEIFREVRRVLRDDGTLWLNYGDCYNSKQATNGISFRRDRAEIIKSKRIPRGKGRYGCGNAIDLNLKPKDLVGMPWRVAFALQADGWWLRSDIIWHKPNSMPESVRDRPSKAHEHLFLMAKRKKYFYDAHAISEKSITKADDKSAHCFDVSGGKVDKTPGKTHRESGKNWQNTGGRNKRDVWTIPTAPSKDAHFATFPPALVEPCILAGTSEKGACPNCGAPWERIVEKDEKILREKASKTPPGQTTHGAFSKNRMDVNPAMKTTGWEPTCKCVDNFERNFSPHQPLEPVPCIILDPFAGSGTTGVVALRHGCNFIGFDLNKDYCEKLAAPRLKAARQGVTLKELKTGQKGLFGHDLHDLQDKKKKIL